MNFKIFKFHYMFLNTKTTDIRILIVFFLISSILQRETKLEINTSSNYKKLNKYKIFDTTLNLEDKSIFHRCKIGSE